MMTVQRISALSALEGNDHTENIQGVGYIRIFNNELRMSSLKKRIRGILPALYLPNSSFDPPINWSVRLNENPTNPIISPYLKTVEQSMISQNHSIKCYHTDTSNTIISQEIDFSALHIRPVWVIRKKSCEI